METCISVFTILILLSYTTTSEANFTVVLEVISNPVAFGETVRLQCNVTGIQQCYSNYVRTWTHGTNDELIFNNGRLNENIVNETKYAENVDNPCQSFSLLIRNFNENDAIDTYGCSFTVDTNIKRDRKTLSLNGTQFEYIPTSDLIETELKGSAGEFNFTVKIKKVHPLPECTSSYKGSPLHLNISQYSVGIFHGVCMTVSSIRDNNFCACHILIICKIGNQVMNLSDVMTIGCGNLINDVEQKKMNVELWWLWFMMVTYQVLPAVVHEDTYRCIVSSLWKRLTRYLAIFSVVVALTVSSVLAKWRNQETLTEFRRYVTQDEWRILTGKICVLLIMSVPFVRRLFSKGKMHRQGVLDSFGRPLIFCMHMTTIIEIYGLYFCISPCIFSSIIDNWIWYITIWYVGAFQWFPEETKNELKDTNGSFETASDGWDNENSNRELNSLITDSKIVIDLNYEDDSIDMASSGVDAHN